MYSLTKGDDFIKNNVLERAIKTFIFAFLGVFIPEVCTVLNSGLATFDTVAIVSMICASLAAALSASWNYLENVWKSFHIDGEAVDVDVEKIE